VLVIRTRQAFFRSRPSLYLLGATLAIGALTLALPFLPLAGLLGFCPLPLEFYLVLGLILILYIAAAEAVKRVFYRQPQRRA
jgi:Mg2+-importing ATPase